MKWFILFALCIIGIFAVYWFNGASADGFMNFDMNPFNDEYKVICSAEIYGFISPSFQSPECIAKLTNTCMGDSRTGSTWHTNDAVFQIEYETMRVQKVVEVGYVDVFTKKESLTMCSKKLPRSIEMSIWDAGELKHAENVGVEVI